MGSQGAPLHGADTVRQTEGTLGADPRGTCAAAGQESQVVIVRVLTARVKPGRVGHFNALMRRQLPIIREQPGLVYVKLARRLEADGGEELVLFEEWRDPDSLYAWVGSDISKPRLLPGWEDSLLDIIVTHYEALDMFAADDEDATLVERGSLQTVDFGRSQPADPDSREPIT
jgi:quinol monooxygenase YgiN